MAASPANMSHESDAAPWVRNAWYVASYSGDLGDKPLGRTICGEAMVFFRTASGVAALEDFCPHRGAPLSLGRVHDDRVVCGYHGLAVNKNGCPAAMPNQRVANFPSVRVFAAIERFGFIWVWP